MLWMILTYPSIDQERQGWDITPGQSSFQRRDVTNNDFDQQGNNCITNLVKDGSSRKSTDVVGGSLDYRTQDVEENG